MKQAPRIGIIIPTYNEAPVIRATLQDLLPMRYELIVVDDGSTDGTRALIADLPIHYLRHPVNLGQGAALQTGMCYAVQRSLAYVLHFDADGQHAAADIPHLLEPLLKDEADVVLGSRFKSSVLEVPLLRRLLLRAAIVFNGLMTGLWLSDAHNGLRALNLRACQLIRLKENGMAHATEILMEIRKHQLRYQEVGVRVRYSAYSQSKGQSAWNALNILSDIILRKLFP